MKRVWGAAFLAVILAVAVLFAGWAIVREREYQALIGRGDAALASGRTYQAIEAFSGALALRGDSVIAFLKRGEAYRQRGEYGAALRDLRTASRLDPSAGRPAELLGDTNYAMERFARAAEDYGAYVALDDSSPRVHYKLGLALFRAGDSAGAIAPLERAIALDNRAAEARYVLGLSLKEQRRLADATAAFEQAVALQPGMVPAREELAAAYTAQRRVRQAIEQLEAIAALEPARPERQTAVALAYARSGRTDEAINALGRAAGRYSDNTPVFLALGRIWLDVATPRRDRVALRKAIEALQPLARRPSASSEVLALYGRALQLSGDTTRAEEVLLQATASLPIYPDALLWQAEAAERLGRLAQARQSLEQWAAIVPASAVDRGLVYERVGQLAARTGDVASALRAFEQAAQAPEPKESTFASLAQFQLAAGRIDGARTTLARGLALYPRSADLLSLQRRLE